jgi:hypothetical protein
MVYNNREYPHPVLGIEDSVLGSFKVHLSVKTGNDIIIEPVYELVNDDLNTLLVENKVEFVTQVYCRSTMYRTNYRTTKSISDKIIIPANELRNEVELDFFICASIDLVSYRNSQAHSDYDNSSFNISKGEILAYGGHGVFHANKTPLELKAISSFMQIDKYDKDNGPIQNFYDGEKIIIRLSINDYNKYLEIAGNQNVEQLLHSGVVLPALMDAIGQVNGASDEFAENNWYKILQGLIDEKSNGNDNPLHVGQKILDYPLNRAFKTIDELIFRED